MIPTCQASGVVKEAASSTATTTTTATTNKLDRYQSGLRNESNNNNNNNYLYVCQITSFEEARIDRIVSSGQSEMILNFDFFVGGDNGAGESLNIVTWSGDSTIRMHELELSQFLVNSRDTENNNTEKSSARLDSETIDGVSALKTTTGGIGPTSIVQLHSNTTNSSRKSSISEHTAYGGTSPANTTSLLAANIQRKERDASFHLANDDQDAISQYMTSTTAQLGRNSINIGVNTSGSASGGGVLKSSSASMAAHEFLKKNPKCFGAKFTGLPG